VRATTRREFLAAGLAAGAGLVAAGSAFYPGGAEEPDFILHNGRIATMDRERPSAQAVAIRGGRFTKVGADRDVVALRGPRTKVVDLRSKTAIPGLNDSHLHVIRGGLNYNLELRWDGVPSLADAMRLLKEQVGRTPPGQWVRVVGGFGELQFAEKRLPTIAELNEAAPDTPVFILHLYDRALLNRAALRAVGYGKDTPDPPGGVIERAKNSDPTGLLVANPNASILYKTLALGPKLPPEHQANSTRHFLRDLNRLGVTSACDAGGGFQNFPADYAVVQDLHKRGELTVRIAYNLFTQNPGKEKDDFGRWIADNRIRSGDDWLRLNGAGEMLVYSAADFEDFRVARPEMPANLEPDLEAVVRLLAKNQWPFRLHATYDETISRALSVFEKVHRDLPLGELRWFFDHCETVGDKNLERIKALGGGIAVQHRMAFQGEWFLERYGKEAAARTPPVKRMLELGLPVGMGTDATRVASYNPWTCLSWLVTGKTVGGTQIYPAQNLLSREDALRLFTAGSAWFSRDDDQKGRIREGQLADLTVLSEDFFAVAPERIRSIESSLTVVGGAVAFAADPFADLAPAPIPVLPEWSPAARFGGHWRGTESRREGGGGGGGAACAAAPRSPEAGALAGGGPGLHERCSCWVF
jgi:predicted amidohydrolase YtcJ